MRGVLNSGHTQTSAYTIRNVKVGEDWIPKRFSTWAAIAVAAIGRLPDTWVDRSIVISMKRKPSGNNVERLGRRNVAARKQATGMTRQIMRWAIDNGTTLATAEPAIPESLDDRAADNWEILLAIADLAGGEWPNLARTAAMALSAQRDDGASLCEALLADIKQVFETYERSPDRLASTDLCAALGTMEGRPWAEYGRSRKPMTPNLLARMLKSFGVAPATVDWPDGRSAKGYWLKWFKEAFDRYLPSVPPVPTVETSNPLAESELDHVSGTSTAHAFDRSEKSTSSLGENGFDVSTVGNGEIDAQHANDGGLHPDNERLTRRATENFDI